MARLTFRPTTAEDVQAVSGGPAPIRIRAVTAVLGGEPIAYGGLGYAPDGTVIAFLEGADRLRKFPKAMHRTVRQGLADARARGLPRILATASPDVEAAERYLVRLGFAPVDVDGRRIFTWSS